ncbi:MAG: GMC family oxidoreductase N-terminal domain-containing protein [Chloroflexi bacterium]|nr:GMC family oxidoreductase N-terminal domain-containing protein [Chloroflexota bacterium]
MPEYRADYVIVGSGTAGSILAGRLSEDPSVSVLLLEFGGMDSNPAIYEKPLTSMFSLWDPKGAENWGYATAPQPGLDGRGIDIARGKVLGGSSAVNAMIYVRGNRRDFDSWASLGVEGLSYDEVLPFFKKSEQFHGAPSDYHGTDGPLSIIDYLAPSSVGHAFIEAAAELGATFKGNDYNGAHQDAGASFYQSTRTPDGVRVTASSAFVTPNLERPNLKLVTGARATRLLLDGTKATGVEIATADGVQSVSANREVIVAAGAFESPKLLMLSGIGPADHLRSVGISVVQDLPGVGQNLQDHLLLGVAYECTEPLNPPEMLAEAALFTYTGVNSRDASPDLQYFFGPVQFVAPEYMTDGPGFTFAPIVAQPLSRGSVTLASTDPTALAKVDPRYLTREEDVAVFEYGIRYARELVQTSAFSKLRGRELAPGPDVTSSNGLRAYIRKSASTVWHPACTCRMGSGPDAVLDSQFKVYGLDGLRVVDASSLPKLVNGNPNAAIMMLAEKAADLIRATA